MNPSSSGPKAPRRFLALWLALCLALLSGLSSQVEFVEDTVDSVQTLSGLGSLELADAPDHDPFPLGLAAPPPPSPLAPTPILALPIRPCAPALPTPPPRLG